MINIRPEKVPKIFYLVLHESWQFDKDRYHRYHSVLGVWNPLKNSVICPPFRSTGYFKIEFQKKIMVHPRSSTFQFREMALQRTVTMVIDQL